jgi:hypothetical protein
VFYRRTYFYNHARRFRLEKLLFKLILDPGGRFASETAARREAGRLQIFSGPM